MRTDSRELRGVSRVRCGACLSEFDALEHIKLEDTLGIDQASLSHLRKPIVQDGSDVVESTATPHIRQRRSVLADAGTERAKRPRLGSRILVTAVVVVALGFVALHSARNHLVENHPGFTLASWWCDKVGCDVETPTDYSTIRLLRRTIYAHPDREEALIISLAMVNDAHFAMDFPVLHVRMTDRDGDVVARGEFAPEDYLDTFDTSVIMQPGRAVDVQLEVTDPGSEAVSFDLEFH